MAIYGISLFCLLPIAIGISSGILPDRRWAIFGTIVSLAIFLILLLTGQAEGFICILMAIPVVAGFIFLGYLIAYVIRKLLDKKPDNKVSVSLFYPFLIFLAANFAEVFWGNSEIRDEVVTSMSVAYAPEKVYDKIINVDTVNVETGFLHKLGLPTPRKCILTAEKTGGKRICIFEEGTIIETIKEYKKGELLKMDVSEYKMPGMRWLVFDEDIYTIKKTANGSAITRTTTYHSQLKPRFYWKFIENLTIGAEQEFVFRNLQKDLKN
jgi:hypothetical protein